MPTNGKHRYWRTFIAMVAGLLVLATASTAILAYSPGDDLFDLTIDETIPDDYKNAVIDDDIFWEVFRPDSSTGSGVFDSFVRIASGPAIVRGYNTDAKVPEFDTKSGGFTHSIALSAINTVESHGYRGREFLIDINETTPDSHMYLDRFQIYLTDTPGILGYDELTHSFPVTSGLTELVWDLDGSGAKSIWLDYAVNTGSGAGDYRVLIPEGYFTDAIARLNTRGYNGPYYVVLFAEHSNTDDGFEEWGVRTRDPMGALQVTKAFNLNGVIGTPSYPTSVDLTIQGKTSAESYYSVPNTITVNAASTPSWTATWNDLVPGTYIISVSNEVGGDGHWTIPTTIEVVVAQATDTVPYTFATVTDVYQPGALHVTKVVDLNEVVGTPTLPNFQITITGPSYPTGNTHTFTYPSHLEYTWMNLIPGDYVVTEGTLGAVWHVTVPAGATVVPENGTGHATVTNDYQPGNLEVTKIVNLHGVIGSPTIPDFEITITGPSYPTGNTHTFTYPSGLVYTWTNLIPGDYVVTEGTLGAVWHVSVPASATAVPIGGTGHATVTNDYQPGDLRVTKIIDWNNVIGTPMAPDFHITITGPSYPSGNTKIFNVANGYIQTWEDLIPGDYVVSETSLGVLWHTVVPAGATVVPAGGIVDATVTNVYQTGALKVTKIFNIGTYAMGSFDPAYYPSYVRIKVTGPSFDPDGIYYDLVMAENWEKIWDHLIPGEYRITEISLGSNSQWWTLPSTPIIVNVGVGTTPMAPASGEIVNQFRWLGFTPGYWKTHPEEWYRTDYNMNQTVRSVFVILDPRYLTGGKLDMNRDGYEDTLMDALNYKGGNDLKGKLQILLRAAVAGILNESALDDYYPPYDSTTELIDAVNVAIASVNKGTLTSLATITDYWNNGIHMFPEP